MDSRIKKRGRIKVLGSRSCESVQSRMGERQPPRRRARRLDKGVLNEDGDKKVGALRESEMDLKTSRWERASGKGTPAKS